MDFLFQVSDTKGKSSRFDRFMKFDKDGGTDSESD